MINKSYKKNVVDEFANKKIYSNCVRSLSKE